MRITYSIHDYINVDFHSSLQHFPTHLVALLISSFNPVAPSCTKATSLPPNYTTALPAKATSTAHKHFVSCRHFTRRTITSASSSSARALDSVHTRSSTKPPPPRFQSRRTSKIGQLVAGDRLLSKEGGRDYRAFSPTSRAAGCVWEKRSRFSRRKVVILHYSKRPPGTKTDF